jgi:hypothetical protein
MRMSEPPLPAEYIESRGSSRRELQERLALWWTERATAPDYGVLSSRTEALATVLGEYGYSVRKLDEDAEHMIAYGVRIGSGESVTIQSFWDEHEGTNASFLFVGPHGEVSLAAGDGEVVEID